ncbi:putative intracellular protease/amidase [Brassicibacter mesophilus]
MGVSKTPITTMGGMKILPNTDLRNCSIKSTDALILPGGDT